MNSRKQFYISLDFISMWIVDGRTLSITTKDNYEHTLHYHSTEDAFKGADELMQEGSLWGEVEE